MPTDEPKPQLPEDFDPDQTLFFKRRKKNVNLLPFVMAGILILGSGALITWALTRSSTRSDDETAARAAAPDAYAGRPLISSAEARALENPPIGPAKELAGTVQPVAAGPAAAPAVKFDASKPVRAALPAGPPGPSPAAAAAAATDEPPPSSIDANAPLNFDVNDPSNAAVRTQVLERIDLMPNISPANKDKLYASVDHARKMGRVLTFPFERGESAAHAADIERLKQQVATPEIKQLLDDPTVVFVVLGYADPKGSEKVNQAISLSRANSVLDALRDKCGFQNVMHAVAMGGSTLFSKQDVNKNRIVEIWAVVP